MLGGAFTLLLLNSAWARGEFTKSCWDIDLLGTSLFADCRERDGGVANAGISLNNRIANDDGQLHWRNNGGYGGSTQNCEVEQDSGKTFLHCDTRKSDGTWTSSSLNLDDHIANIDGSLRYQD